VHRDRLAGVLLPAGFGCEQSDGWSDFRMRSGVTVVAVSAEEPGCQVSVEGPMPDDECERLVIALTQQIEQAAGEPCEWLRITSPGVGACYRGRGCVGDGQARAGGVG
jgi:hypothetical protein